MAFNSKSRGSGSTKGRTSDRVLHRLVLALSISVILHIVVAISMRPDYKPVADHAVDFTVSRVTPGPPPEKPEKEPETEKQPEEEAEPETEEKPLPKETGLGDGEKEVAPTEVVKGAVDAGTADGGVPGDGEAVGVVASGGGTGSGICMPNLFPFSRRDSSWMLWVSLSSFRETSMQKAVGSTLSRFAIGKEIVVATGLDPDEDVEGVLVAATDIFKLSSYRIVLGYDSLESKLKRALTGNLSKEREMKWIETPSGWSGQMGNSAWHLVGSGRVLVAGEKASGETGMPGGEPKWPEQVECVSKRSIGITSDAKDSSTPPNEKRLTELIKTFVSPDATGRWPVALLATSDPRSLGLGRGSAGDIGFQHAVIRAFFSDPILIEGEVFIKGPINQVAALAENWRRIAATVSKDPFFAIAGLSKLFDRLTLEAKGNRIVFSLRLTEGQARAGLLFMQLQGEALERHLKGQ